MPDRSSPLTLLVLILTLAACGDAREGRTAYEAGRFDEAYAAFARAAEPAAEASPELHFNLALAALRAGKLREAEEAVTLAAERSEGGTGDLVRFLTGNIAFARATVAGAQATSLEAEPFAFDLAIRFADRAIAHWRAAVIRRDDWPAARRNVERALLLREELEREKAKREPPRNPDPTPKPRPLPEPEIPKAPEKTEEEHRARPGERELSTEEIDRLFSRLSEKEREKRELRRQRREAAARAVDGDW